MDEKKLSLCRKINEYVISVIRSKAEKAGSDPKLIAKYAQLCLEFANLALLFGDITAELSSYINHCLAIRELLPDFADSNELVTFNKCVTALSSQTKRGSADFYIGGFLVTGGDRFQDFEGWIDISIECVNHYSEAPNKKYWEVKIKPLVADVNKLIDADNSGELKSQIADLWLCDTIAQAITGLDNTIEFVRDYLGLKRVRIADGKFALDRIKMRFQWLCDLLHGIDVRDARLIRDIFKTAKFADHKLPPESSRAKFKEKISAQANSVAKLIIDYDEKPQLGLTHLGRDCKSHPDKLMNALVVIKKYVSRNSPAYGAIETLLDKLACATDDMIVTIISMLHPQNHHTCVRNIAYSTRDLKKSLELIGHFTI